MTRVTVLGSGDAFGSGGRAHSAYLVEGSRTTLLVDCGPSILQSLKREGRDPGALDHVVLSHLHGDHFGGVPFLFLEYRYEAPRTRPLTVYGPRGTGAAIERLFTALYEAVSRKPSPFPVRYVELEPGVPTTIGDARVLPFAVPHAPELACLGVRIEIDGRTIVYSGDSSWTDEFVAQTRGADLFLCECSTYETPVPIHLSYPEIAARVGELGCRRVVLSHLGSEPLRRLDEISLECASDGLTIAL